MNDEQKKNAKKNGPARAGTHMSFAGISDVRVGGLIAEGLETSRNGRLKWFIQNETSEAIQIYRRGVAAKSDSIGWKGECAGKWLYAASRCAIRTGDRVLRSHIRHVADFLAREQNENGYLGTYSEEARFCSASGKPRQTFDLWMNGYVMQGLMEAYRLLGKKEYLAAVCKIGELCIRTYRSGAKSIVNAGPFSGMASACVLEHFVDLFDFTGEKRYLDFAEHCVRALDARPGVEMIRRALMHYDAAQIDEGKMYEMLRCFTGIVKLAGATGDKKLLEASQSIWHEIRQFHLNAAGAPCGGMGGHPECFNVRYTFSPYAFSETCAMMEWLRFNIELLRVTGKPVYAEQIEQASYNALPGAQFPDGYGWTYHSVMNGRRARTGDFACCSSSGAMALEEIPPVVYSTRGDDIFVNLYSPSKARIALGGEEVLVEQITDYPFGGRILIRMTPAREMKFTLNLRVPEWLGGAAFTIDGKKAVAGAGTFHTLSRKWKPGDSIVLEFPMPLRISEQKREYNEKGWYLDGITHFRAIHKGPLLYATGWKDLPDRQNPLEVTKNFSPDHLKEVPTPKGFRGTAVRCRLARGTPDFRTYYEVCGRKKNAAHLVWLKSEE